MSFLLFTTLLLLGAGCGDEKVATPGATLTTSPVTITKKPAQADTTNIFASYCEKQGFTIGYRTNVTSKLSEVYCVFPGNTACEAGSFLTGACTPINGLATPFGVTDEETLAALRSCDGDEPPVCGANGQNYANYCVAELQNIAIKHDGLCDPSELTPVIYISPSSQPINGAPSSPSSAVSALPSDQTASWLALLTMLIETETPKNPRAFIEECAYGNTKVWFQSNGCANCFSILYDASGKILCYPNNDLNKSCPAFFSMNNRMPHCKKIWEDTR